VHRGRQSHLAEGSRRLKSFKPCGQAASELDR
jgi:hypothetical protein